MSSTAILEPLRDEIPNFALTGATDLIWRLKAKKLQRRFQIEGKTQSWQRTSETQIPPAVLGTEARSVSFRKWDGIVLEDYEDSFLASMMDERGESEEIVADLLKQELAAEDLKRVRVGAPFVLTIHVMMRGAQKVSERQIYFRRLPPITHSDRERAREAAKQT